MVPLFTSARWTMCRTTVRPLRALAPRPIAVLARLSRSPSRYRFDLGVLFLYFVWLLLLSVIFMSAIPDKYLRSQSGICFFTVPPISDFLHIFLISRVIFLIVFRWSNVWRNSLEEQNPMVLSQTRPITSRFFPSKYLIKNRLSCWSVFFFLLLLVFPPWRSL